MANRKVRMNIRLSLIRLMLLMSVLLTEGCDHDDSQPATPVLSTETILVDRNDPKAVAAPCGSTNAVCASITDGLRSAALVRDGIPMVFIKAGTYDAEPAYPIQVSSPVMLKAEPVVSGQSWPVTLVIPTNSDGMLITAADVTLDGLLIESGAEYSMPTAIQIAESGRLTMRNTQLRLRSQLGNALDIKKHGQAVIQRSIIEGGDIDSSGDLTIQDSTIQASDKSYPSIDISGGSLVLHRNSLDASISEWGASVDGVTVRTELEHNTILGGLLLVEGKITLIGNTILAKDAICTTGLGCTPVDEINIISSRYPAVWIRVGKSSHAEISDNMITGSLWLMGPLTATLSLNRVGAMSCYDSQVKTDGTNILLRPEGSVDCDGLPSQPGINPF